MCLPQRKLREAVRGRRHVKEEGTLARSGSPRRRNAIQEGQRAAVCEVTERDEHAAEGWFKASQRRKHRARIKRLAPAAVEEDAHGRCAGRVDDEERPNEEGCA